MIEASYNTPLFGSASQKQHHTAQFVLHVAKTTFRANLECVAMLSDMHLAKRGDVA